MQVTNRMNGDKHVLYSRSLCFNTEYIVEKDCSKCDKCDKCIYSTYIYLIDLTDKYKYIDIREFQCPCPTIILKDIVDKKLHKMILKYLL
jgi:hypothetical protein